MQKKLFVFHTQIYFYFAYIGNMTLPKEQKREMSQVLQEEKHAPICSQVTPSHTLYGTLWNFTHQELDWFQAVGTVH